MIEFQIVSRKKYEEIVYKLECLLSHATGGRYSKSGYSINDMEKMVDDFTQELIDEEVYELRKNYVDAVTVVHCKDCKHYVTDYFVKTISFPVPIIAAHNICKFWGGGCKTSEEGYCFKGERKEESE